MFCQVMYSLCKLPCDFDRDTSQDTVRYLFAGNCFFRYASHTGFIILAILNALYRKKPRFVYNHLKMWKMIAPIFVILGGTFGLLLPVFSPNIFPQWMVNYHTYCWLWYQPQFNATIGGLVFSIVVILIALSIAIYSRVVSRKEINKLNINVKLNKFIIQRNNSSKSLIDHDGDLKEGLLKINGDHINEAEMQMHR